MTDAGEMAENVEDAEPVEGEAVDVELGDAEPVEDPTEGLRKALQAERKAHREAERARKAAEQALADKDKPAEEAAIEQARREGRAEGQSAANERYKRLELKAALAGRVASPDKVLKLIDTSGIDVDEDGEVDGDAVQEAIASLFADFPELAVKGRFPGSADQGAKNKSSELSQLTQSDIERMTPEQVVEARKAGRLNKLMGVS